MGCPGDEGGHGGIIGATVDSVSAGALVCRSLKGAPPSSNPSFTPVGEFDIQVWPTLILPVQRRRLELHSADLDH